jgi:hypothetical protein
LVSVLALFLIVLVRLLLMRKIRVDCNHVAREIVYLRPYMGHVFHGPAPAWMIVCRSGRHGVINPELRRLEVRIRCEFQCCALPSSVWFLISARREKVGFLEFQMSLRGVLGLGRGRFLKNLVYKHQTYYG